MRIHADRALFIADHPAVLLLQPFWGSPPEVPGVPTNGRFAAYLSHGRGLFELCDPTSADIHVYPNVYDHIAGRSDTPRRVETFLQDAASAAKPAVIFAGSDSDERLPVANAWTFRPSLSRSTRGMREFAIPAWSEDFVERYLGGELPVRSKRRWPVVGFCGYAASPGTELRHAVARRLVRGG